MQGVSWDTDHFRNITNFRNQILGDWEELNHFLREYLGRDAEIGHSYLFELEKDLKNLSDLPKDDDGAQQRRETICAHFWRFSILPQLCDILDSTGRPAEVYRHFDDQNCCWKMYHGISVQPPTDQQLETMVFARTTIQEGKPNKKAQAESYVRNQEAKEQDEKEAQESSEKQDRESEIESFISKVSEKTEKTREHDDIKAKGDDAPELADQIENLEKEVADAIKGLADGDEKIEQELFKVANQIDSDTDAEMRAKELEALLESTDEASEEDKDELENLRQQLQSPLDFSDLISDILESDTKTDELS